MSVVKKYNKLLGLDKIDVLVDHIDTSRHIVITDMPESLPQGKSSFLIEVSSHLKLGVELQIDFIDSNGNSIYTEPISNYLEGSSRTTSVEVYDNVAPGVATLIIVGELETIPLNPGDFSGVEIVPSEWQGVYNLRLTREVIINVAAINTQPIKFHKNPQIVVTEQRFGTGVVEQNVNSFTSGEIELEGVPITEDTTADSEALGETWEIPSGDFVGDQWEVEAHKQVTKKKSRRGDSKAKRGRRASKQFRSTHHPYSFTVSSGSKLDDDGNVVPFTFTSAQISGSITFSDFDTSETVYNQTDFDGKGLGNTSDVTAQILNSNHPDYPVYYTASIAAVDLEAPTVVYPVTPFTKQATDDTHKIIKLKSKAVVRYTSEPSHSYSLVNLVSYANVTLNQLETFSGDVFKTKVYVRAEGSFDEYKLLAEVPLESPELMINSSSIGVGERTGYFISQTDKNTYWTHYGGVNGLSAATSTTTSSYDTTTALDTVQLSGSLSLETNQLRFQLKDAYNFNLDKTLDYSLSFRAIGQKGIDGRALMLIYVSGSSMKQASDLFNDVNYTEADIAEPSAYGKRLGWLKVEAGDDIEKRFGLITHNFEPNLTGDAIVQFRVISGKWNIADISLRPSSDTGFSPKYINFKQELPPELQHKRPENLEFLAEFYDINNNISDAIAYLPSVTFTGANLVITGTDNVLQQNLFIGGDTTASGIHMGGTTSTLPDNNDSDGADGSGFIRSIGYLGFTSASDASEALVNPK